MVQEGICWEFAARNFYDLDSVETAAWEEQGSDVDVRLNDRANYS